MPNEKNNTAPVSACIFEQMGEVQFAEAGDKTKKEFEIIAYSGQVMAEHFFWGNVAFDLKGLEFAKDPTPVLDQHETTRRIGFSTKQEIKNNVRIEGKFLSNPNAQQLKQDVVDGFPMEASMFVPPSIIEHVGEGETVIVNGHKLEGPGAVFRKAKIKDVSFATFGKDSKTKSKVFDENSNDVIQFSITEKEQIIMDDETKIKLTAELLTTDYPEVFAEVTKAAKEEGEKAVRDLLTEFSEKFADDPGFCLEQFKAGATLDAAVQAENAKLKTANTQLAEKATEAAAAGQTPDAAHQEFSDQQTGNEQPQDDNLPPGEKYKKEFDDSPDIRKEFAGASGLEDYKAFRRNEDKGLIKIKSDKPSK